MKNCIILGAGRSGTSMVAGTLANAGYYMGDTMLPPTDANPKGYYESREVEALNDHLIRAMLHPTPAEMRLRWQRRIPRQPDFKAAQSWAKVRWLALIPPVRVPVPDADDIREIQRLTSHTPFCFKDPRFSYTLPAWQPHLHNTVFICVFREPAITARSILKEVERDDYLNGIPYTLHQAFTLWGFTYRHILEKHRHQGEWLFLHYNQVFTPQGLDSIEALTHARVNRQFPDERLARTRADNARVPWHIRRTYRQLCTLAGYRP